MTSPENMCFDKYEKLGDYHWKEYRSKGLYWEHAERIKKWITEKHVLDVGAGDGLITSLINAIGIDNNIYAPKLAKMHDVDVLIASAYQIPFNSESFEAVFMGDVIEHLENEQIALKEIRRIIKENGHLYVTTPPALMDGSQHDPYHLREYTKNELISTVQNCGFQCLESFIDDKKFNIYAKFQKSTNIETFHPIKALFFTHSSYLGGAERSLIELVRELIQRYNMICTVVLPSEGPSIKMLEEVGADTIIAPLNWWCTLTDLPADVNIHHRYEETFSWIIENLNMFTRVNPDIIFTNTLVIPWGAITAALFERPHIWLINEFGKADHGLNFYKPFNQVLDFIENSSDLIITRSKAIQEQLFPNLGEDKIQTIYRHISLPGEDNLEEKPIQNPFKIHDACHLIIYGGLGESKGQADAVRSVTELVKKRNKQVELVMIGDPHPDYLKYLERLISDEKMEDYIHILPFMENVFPLVNQADIILVCSRMEAFGRVVMEGLLMKKPVIATISGGTPELITDGETGLLYTPGDYLQLADKIEILSDDPVLRQKLAQEGYKFVSQTFTKERFIEPIYQAISGLLNKDYQQKDGIDNEIKDQFINALKCKIERENEVGLKISKLEQEVLFYSQSKSWKLTKPLRIIMNFFKRIRQS